MLKNPGKVADAARVGEFSYVSDEALLMLACKIPERTAKRLLGGQSIHVLAQHEDPNVSVRIRACIEVARRAQSPRPEKGSWHSSRSVAAAYNWLTHESEEQVWCAYLDGRHQPVFEERMVRGGGDQAPFDIRAVLTRALRVGARAIVLVHNHPSGNPQPSVEDNDLTLALVTACKAIGVPLVDHVIVARSGHYSYLDAGLIEQFRRIDARNNENNDD